MLGLLDKFFGPPSKGKFARLLSDAIRQAGETATIRYDAQEFRLVVEGKRFFNLANIYGEYCATPPAGRRQALRHYARSWFANRKGIPSDFEDLGPDLLPAVRNRCDMEVSRLQAQIDGLPPLEWPYQVVAEHLAVSLVYDLPEALMQVQERHLSNWGRSLAETLAAPEGEFGTLSNWSLPTGRAQLRVAGRYRVLLPFSGADDQRVGGRMVITRQNLSAE